MSVELKKIISLCYDVSLQPFLNVDLEGGILMKAPLLVSTRIYNYKIRIYFPHAYSYDTIRVLRYAKGLFF
jgi:hypothetical protein